MQLITSSKIPLLKAINLSEIMIDYYPIEITLITVEKGILQGEPLHKSLIFFHIQ